MIPDLPLADFPLQQVVRELGWRLDAPFQLRLLLQPLLATLLGIRDGRLDAKTGLPPYLADLVAAVSRGDTALKRGLKRGLATAAKPLAIAVILDAVVQFLFYQWINPFEAVLVGVLLVGTPYSLARGLANRLAARRARTNPTDSTAAPEQ